MPQILIFGDSIAYGAWDKEGGWVERLKKEISKKVIAANQQFYCPVYNLGIDGDTTGGVIERFENETKKRLLEDETILFLQLEKMILVS